MVINDERPKLRIQLSGSEIEGLFDFDAAVTKFSQKSKIQLDFARSLFLVHKSSLEPNHR